VTDPLQENVDLDLERRKWVLDAYERLAQLTHYDLLSIPRDADKKAIKKAYFHLAGRIHPDRFYGKNLGSYRPKIEALFVRVSDAYETLMSEERRAAYDRTLPTAAAQAPAPKAPMDPREAAKQKAALDALKQKLTEGKAKAAQHIQAAQRAKAAGDFSAAAKAYKMALIFSPNDPELKAACTEMERASTQRLVESHKRQALLEERHGHWNEAAASWKRALDLSPNDVEMQTRLQSALARARGG
jgi:curved DNA-binding protein CbpA